MRRRQLVFYFLSLPAVLGFAFFKLVPSVLGVYYGFTSFNGFGHASFVGLRNFVELFSDPDIQTAYWFTFRYAVLSTILVNIGSLALAVGLNTRIGIKGVIRSVFFLPAVLGPLIIGYIFNYIFAGIVPLMGRAFHIAFLEQNLLTSFSFAWIAVVIVGVWQYSAVTIILYLAGLQSIPEELYEAAVMDGSTGLRTFFSITFPLLAPIFTISIVLTTKQFMGVFDQIVSLTDGGPGTATTSVTFLIWNDGFAAGHFGYESANAVLFMLIMIMIAFFQIRLLQRREARTN